MIDVFSETTFPLSAAPEHLPALRRGRKPSVATLYRWSSVGLRGIRLETVQIGGCRCTSTEALQRFFDRLSRPQEVATVLPRGDEHRPRPNADQIDQILESQGL